MKSLLLVRLSSLGDIAQALPVAAWMHSRGIRTGWLVEERFARLLSLLSFPVEVLPWRRGLRGCLDLRGKGRGWDGVCDIQGNWKSGFLSCLLGGGRIFGLAREDVRELGNLLWSEKRASPRSRKHVLDRSLSVISTALDRGIPREELPKGPFLVPEKASVASCRRILDSLGLGQEGPFFTVVLGRREDPRSWPMGRILDFVGLSPLPLLLLGGPEEEGMAIPDGLPFWSQPRGSLSALVALGSILASRRGWAVGPDGGAMHVLSAAGARTHFLYGSQDPGRTAPPGGSWIRSSIDLPCMPCSSRTCDLPEGPRCMEELGAQMVLASLSADPLAPSLRR